MVIARENNTEPWRKVCMQEVHTLDCSWYGTTSCDGGVPNSTVPTVSSTDVLFGRMTLGFEGQRDVFVDVVASGNCSSYGREELTCKCGMLT